MIRTAKISASLAAIALAASAALAQDQQTAPTGSGSQTSSLQQAQAQEFFRASNLIGKSTQDSKGTKLGTLKDVVFNQQGEVFAFVDIGGGKWAAVPWQVVNPASAKGRDNVVLNTSQQQLKSAPSVAKDQWGSLNNPAFAQGIYSYYQVQAPAAVGGASSPGSSNQGQSTGTSTDPNTSTTTPGTQPPQSQQQ